jgi:hypothetical protein
MGDVTLKVPLRLLPLWGSGQRHHATESRVQALGDAFDHAAFPSAIAPSKITTSFSLRVGDPILKLNQLCMEREERAEFELTHLSCAPFLSVEMTSCIPTAAR